MSWDSKGSGRAIQHHYSDLESKYHILIINFLKDIFFQGRDAMTLGTGITFLMAAVSNVIASAITTYILFSLAKAQAQSSSRTNNDSGEKAEERNTKQFSKRPTSL
jgi:hypothetical protein